MYVLFLFYICVRILFVCVYCAFAYVLLLRVYVLQDLLAAPAVMRSTRPPGSRAG